MDKFVEIKFQGKPDQFFVVSYKILDSSHKVIEGGEGSLPACPELVASIKDWRAAYHADVRFVRLEKNPNTVKNSSEINHPQLTDKLNKNLNSWLSSPEFLPTKDKLMAGLNRSQVVLVGIDINDPDLKYAPWHLWSFFEHFPRSDYALLRPNFSKLDDFSNGNKVDRSKLNIIAIIGDSTGINTGEDTTIIKSLPGVNHLQVLGEPSKDKVTEVLWNSENTDILFFAGHGKKDQDRGRICINGKETLGVEEMRSGLQKRIQEGLQLAIFNSCDGLEFGEELADLSIPQAIVMKEAVPDDIAQRFLKDFLTEFSQGVPLVQALRQTRNKLKDKEYEYPYASWLPVLYCNPTEPLMRWSRPQPPFLQRYPWQTKLAASCLVGLVGITSWTAYAFKSNQLLVGDNQRDTSQIVNKTYEEKSYGISLKYPPNWVLQEKLDSITGDVVKLFPQGKPEVELILRITDLSDRSPTLEEFKNKIREDLKTYSEEFSLIQEESATLARGDGYRLAYITTRGGIRYQGINIFSMKGNKGYVMTYLTPESPKFLFAEYESVSREIIDSLIVVD